AYSGEQQVDVGREVKVQFMTSNKVDRVWEFRSAGGQLVVHPGAVNQMVFYARNPSDKPMTAQAIPSIAPAEAAAPADPRADRPGPHRHQPADPPATG
ncbi:cytochrome c oxidase assembly protein, partial [Klebsiella pneumoniae]|uniref:cytochrome c oxidase assembly protein n=1 Tax=Klebsiella pneumoniae TaxID=573 RepID=UPI0024AFC8A3